MTEKTDLLGDPITDKLNLRDRFIEPPFSVLDSRADSWIKRKAEWKKLGLKSELGRDVKVFTFSKWLAEKAEHEKLPDQSIFDPVLCEVLYHWFVPDGGSVLDPFAGGSVRGVVAHKKGYKYTGIDIRPEQIASNIEQCDLLLPMDNKPVYLAGDSTVVLDDIVQSFDFVFSCPPYANLEVYSDLQGDISRLDYADFLDAYTLIIQKSCLRLNRGGFACFVVGEVRDKKGNYYGFVPDTVKIFQAAGMNFYNEAILFNVAGSAALRAAGYMVNKKLVKTHQNVLVFKK